MAKISKASSSKRKQNTSTGSKKSKQKNGGFWTRNKIIVVIAVITFAALGVMVLKNSSAATTNYASFLNTGCNSTPTLSVGSKGPCVQAVQKGLNQWTANTAVNTGSKNSGPAPVYLTEDGVYGNATKNKVIVFQKDRKRLGKNLRTDGVFDAATWVAFLSDCNVFNTCKTSGSK
ncbi:peptidoglycan-binding protein [Candidatus Saccharibacteria bacterium]|nr:peptidoglycan-binding protein [Candidatus Saccharibacteria bacterium]